MKYKRQVVTSMLAFSLIAGGTSAFAADINATTTKINQYSNQIKMRSTTKNDKSDLVTTGTSTKRNKNKVRPTSLGKNIEAKDVNGKDIETNDDSNKTTSTSTKNKINKVHDKVKQKSHLNKNQTESI